MAELQKQLLVKLSDDEWDAKSDELARLVNEHQALSEKKKLSNKELSDELKQLDEVIFKTADIVRTRTEMRMVNCEEVPNWDRDTVDTVRKDTGETVEIRPLTWQERQRPFDFFGDGLKMEVGTTDADDKPKPDED